MTEVTILHEAEMELWEAVAFYEHKAAGLGFSFLAEIERSIQIIRESPGQWPLREDGTRRYLTHRFPFLIIYTCQNDHVWVIAFAHCRRKPGYWSDRD
ncbi:MAG TPA: type II toxin-antitoxin system RelE/ParE family toxin [Desulfonatronum sp.]|nr:type II toxin-antitoxin system RelE/ParE family toxin [Desulfonatronum sp.]